MTHHLRNSSMLLLGDLVGFPTVTSESNLDLIEYAASYLEAFSSEIRITRDVGEQKANLLATIGPPADGGVILSGHSDVVPADDGDWTGTPFVAMRRDQKIYGRGTTDMKGFIACALATAPTYAEMDLKRPIHLAITFDEEVGCHGAPLLIADLVSKGPKPAAVIVGEPTEMAIVTAHKGCYEYTTTITGIEGHGSQPDHGVNAVHHGAAYVAKLLDLARALAADPPDNSPYDPRQTTISVGTINGGSARNVLAGECVIEWEMRPVRRTDADMVLSAMAAFETELARAMGPEASVSTVCDGDVDGLEHDDQSVAVRLMKELLVRNDTHVVPFGTEAGLYQQAGIPAVVCGPGSIDVVHQPDEYVSLEQLEACLKMMEGLGEKLSTT